MLGWGRECCHRVLAGEATGYHNLGQLQGERQKSCETGAKLYNLTGTMNDIYDTLGGFLVSDYKNIVLLLN